MSGAKRIGRPPKDVRKIDTGKRISVILGADTLGELDRIRSLWQATTTQVVEAALLELGKKVQ